MLSRARVLQLRADYNAGFTLTQLQQKYGHSITTLRRWILTETELPAPHTQRRSKVHWRFKPKSKHPVSDLMRSFNYHEPLKTLLSQCADFLDKNYGWNLIKFDRFYKQGAFKSYVANLGGDVSPSTVDAILNLSYDGLFCAHNPPLEDSGELNWAYLDVSSVTVITEQGPKSQALYVLTLPAVTMSVGFVQPGPSFEGMVAAFKFWSKKLGALPNKIQICSAALAAAITRPLREHEMVLGGDNPVITPGLDGNSCAFSTDFMNFKLALGCDIRFATNVNRPWSAYSSLGEASIALTLAEENLLFAGDYEDFNAKLWEANLSHYGFLPEQWSLFLAGLKEQPPQVPEALYQDLPRDLLLALKKQFLDFKPQGERLFSFPDVTFHQVMINQFGRIRFEDNEYALSAGAPGTLVVLVVAASTLEIRSGDGKAIISYPRCFEQGRYFLIWSLEIERLIAQPAAFARSRLALEFDKSSVNRLVSYGFAAVKATLYALQQRLEHNDVFALAQLFKSCSDVALETYDVESDNYVAVLIELLKKMPLKADS